MSPPRPPRPRDRQRGNTLLLALIVLSALATLGSLTVVSVQSNLKTATNDRAQSIALYAAESGAAVAMDVLRSATHFNATSGWSAYVSQSNGSPYVMSATDEASIGAKPTDTANRFTIDQNAWYEVMLLNNRDDLGFDQPSNCDQDGRIIIRATGHGPQGSLAIIEWDVQRAGFPSGTPSPPPAWASPPSGMVLMSWRVITQF